MRLASPRLGVIVPLAIQGDWRTRFENHVFVFDDHWTGMRCNTARCQLVPNAEASLACLGIYAYLAITSKTPQKQG